MKDCDIKGQNRVGIGERGGPKLWSGDVVFGVPCDLCFAELFRKTESVALPNVEFVRDD